MTNKSKFTLGFFLFCIIMSVFGIVLFSSTQSADTVTKLWQFQSIDTMKYSRDAAGDKSVLKHVPFFVKEVADMKATHIAIDTPYDEEFYPVLAAWVTEARKYNLKIWFRGNFSSWEGWFNRKKMENPNDHHSMIKKFIIDHPDLFQDGDIFTPVPEPENGAIGDPRSSDEKAKQFNQFLIDSYNNCVSSFQLINKEVHCGYFSMNGDVAKNVLTKDTVSRIGNVVVIDHYVDTADRMENDIDYLNKKFGAKIVLGEFGGPIPDINGTMTEEEQAKFVDNLLQVFKKRNDIIEGINY